MLVGYCRTSLSDDRQCFDLQLDALESAGIDRRHVFMDRASGAKARRPGLDSLVDFVQSGEAVITWKFDRISRSAIDLITLRGVSCEGRRPSVIDRTDRHRDAVRPVRLHSDGCDGSTGTPTHRRTSEGRSRILRSISGSCRADTNPARWIMSAASQDAATGVCEPCSMRRPASCSPATKAR